MGKAVSLNDNDIARLPDLPNNGYGTHKEKELSDAIMFFMRGMERDRLTMLNIVLGGLALWRKTARGIWRGFNVPDEPIDEIYRYFCIQASQPEYQVLMLDAIKRKNVDLFRDALRHSWPSIEEQQRALAVMEKWTPYERQRGGRLIM